ncbi:glycosyltransferase family 1 protein [Fictibacillus sp. NRS-1165]|uniref:glycosyltransferase family 1 protein n=1 Tax=Fictibacillus sp. NRS-1165 TaxID=3144463 RepID=UPI003D228451
MDSPIRILHCFGRMGIGGAETFIMNIYRNIDRNKIQFDFVVHTEKECDYDKEIYNLGGRIFRVPRYNVKNHFSYIKSWHTLFQTHIGEWKIIHGHMDSTATIYLNIAKRYDFLTISHSHSTSSGTGIKAAIKNLLHFPIKYNTDFLFACSNRAGRWLYGESACKKENFYILNNCIDSKKFIYNTEIRIEKRKELKLEDNLVVGHIGSMGPPKNHDLLIDIFKEINKKNKNSILLIIGDGYLRGNIEKKVNELGLEKNVIFTGIRTDISDLLQAMDVFIFPSLYEGLPVTLVEAQASGLPCLVSKNITTEVEITKLIEFISLEKPPGYWADQALHNANNMQRQNTSNEIRESGYDVKENANWLENFYLEAL